jgi:hypothetical protein
MIENSNAMFHILLMPTRWLQDDAWNQVDFISKEPFIGTSSKNLKQSQDNDIAREPDFVPMHYNNIQEVQTRHYIQKKIDYGRLMGHFKKALDYSLEDNDQKNLDDIILGYISEQQAKRQAKVQSEMGNVLKEHRNNEIKLSDGRVYDVDDVKAPIKHNCKGRPAIKRLKSYSEEKNKASIRVQNENLQDDGKNLAGRKCGLCHKIGHYAPKCPDKNN